MFPIVLGLFLPFWGGHFVGVATTRLQLLSRRVCGLRFANEEVAELEAGHGLYLGYGRGWEVWGFRMVPQKPRGGQNGHFVVVKFVVLAGHVVI